MSDKEIRTYPRVAPEIRLQVRALPGEPSPFQEGVVGNVSLGGMFIETEEPLAPGQVLRIEFDTGRQGAADSAVIAKAVVRWRRRVFDPRGMGVQFLEFEGLTEEKLEEWLNSVMAES